MNFYIKTSFLIITLLYGVCYAQERVTFEKHNVSIEQPESFEKVDFFEGLYSKSTGASIQIETVDGVTYPFLAKGFTEDNLIPQGVTLKKKEEIQMQSGDKGLLIFMEFNVTQNGETRVFKRITLLTGNLSKTLMINTNFSPEVETLVYPAIYKALLSAKLEE